jgi:hypothetical protein
MLESNAATKAQEERARRLMQQIENPSIEPAPASPRDFINKRMRELNRLKKGSPAQSGAGSKRKP